MEEKNNQSDANQDQNSLRPLLKINLMRRSNYAFGLMLRKDDILVALDSVPYRNDVKELNKKLKVEEKTLITIYRNESFFHINSSKPLGCEFIEISPEETNDVLEKFKEVKIEDVSSFKRFEVFRGPKHTYNLIEDNDPILASVLPPVWLMHQRLYTPLFLLMATYILLGSIKWWLFLASWVMVSLYMSKKGSISLLRGYSMLKDMRLYMYIDARDLQNAQEIVRGVDKKSKFDFSMIPPPVIKEDKKNKDDADEVNDSTEEDKATTVAV